MNRTRFRHPKEMPKDEDRVPVSTRIKKTTKLALERAAKKHDLSLAILIANTLDDYAEWLKDQEEKD